jgi:proteic killer suppression protein
MIKSFGNELAEAIYNRGALPRNLAKQFPKELIAKAAVSLDRLNAAIKIESLYFPPSNHFEALSGDLAEYYSVRINQRWRIIFRWEGENAYEVKVIDYH